MSLAPYESSFGNWDARASVRARPRRALDEKDESTLFFPPENVPAMLHPLVAEREPQFGRRILLHTLYQYLHFTTVLEQVSVLPVTARISLGQCGVRLPAGMRNDAFNITTDEAWHAQFSNDFIRQLETVTEVAADAVVEPAFVTRLEQIRMTLDPSFRRLVDLLFAVVSETLVSKLLSQIPHDRRVAGPVREIVADHAADEGRHHAYFREYVRRLWPQMSPAEQRLMGARVPEFVVAFLHPDLAAVSRTLLASGYTAREAETIVAQSYAPASPSNDIASVAKATVASFREVGALEEESTAQAFAAAGLIS